MVHYISGRGIGFFEGSGNWISGARPNVTNTTAAGTATAISRISRSCVSTSPATQPPPWKNITAGMILTCSLVGRCVRGPRPSGRPEMSYPQCSLPVFRWVLFAGLRVQLECWRPIGPRAETGPRLASSSTKNCVDRFENGRLYSLVIISPPFLPKKNRTMRSQAPHR